MDNLEIFCVIAVDIICTIAIAKHALKYIRKLRKEQAREQNQKYW